MSGASLPGCKKAPSLRWGKHMHPGIVTLLKLMRRAECVASSPGSTEGDHLFVMQFVVGRYSTVCVCVCVCM